MDVKWLYPTVTALYRYGDTGCMRYDIVVPLFAVAGAVVGIYALFSVWAFDITGINLMSSSLVGWEKYIPMIVVVLCVFSLIVSILFVLSSRCWYMIYVAMVFGIIILIMTSLFSMWSVEGVRASTQAGLGMWLSYGSGALMMLGAAIQYAYMCTKAKMYRSI